MSNFKLKEIDKTFDTLISTFYKNKLLSIIPDIVFTLESTRIKKATTVLQHYLKSKHKRLLSHGLSAFRQNLRSFYLLQNHLHSQSKSTHLACSLMSHFFKRQDIKTLHQSFFIIREWTREARDRESAEAEEREERRRMEVLEEMHRQAESRDGLMLRAHRAYKHVIAFAGFQGEHAEEDYRKLVMEVVGELVDREEVEVRFEEIGSEGAEEDFLDFRWVKQEDGMVMNLNKPAPKTHQYRVHFKGMAEEEVEELGDATQIVKLLISMMSWIKTLKELNSMLMNDEVVPLRQDCKTLTIVNAVRSILEDANNYSDFEENVERLAFNPRELQEFLQSVCQKVFSTMNIQTECSFIQSSIADFNNHSETQSECSIKPKRGADGNLKLPLGEHKNYEEERLIENNEMDITYTHEMIVLK